MKKVRFNIRCQCKERLEITRRLPDDQIQPWCRNSGFLYLKHRFIIKCPYCGQAFIYHALVISKEHVFLADNDSTKVSEETI